MKTNQILKRGPGFFQRTKDGYFNANVLLTHWKDSTGDEKKLGNYKSNQSTKDYIVQLQKEGIRHPFISGRGSGEHSGTWMHSKLFIDFAMWVSVEFKSVVIDYVLDGLIQSRNDAGDYYNQMTAQIMDSHIEHYRTKPNPHLYIVEANMVREIAGIDKGRNELGEKQLNDLTILQKLNTMLIRNNVGRESRKKQLINQKALLDFV